MSIESDKIENKNKTAACECMNCMWAFGIIIGSKRTEWEKKRDSHNMNRIISGTFQSPSNSVTADYRFSRAMYVMVIVMDLYMNSVLARIPVSAVNIMLRLMCDVWTWNVSLQFIWIDCR